MSGRELDETDPTPPEYEEFKTWFWGGYPDGPAKGTVAEFQPFYRAFQAGYHARDREGEREP
jgi:hypothetical protein